MDLESGRRAIASIDEEIIRLIAKRTDTAEQIGLIKKENGLPVRNPEVEAKVISRYEILADGLGISRETARKVAELLIKESVRRQEGTIGGGDE